MTAQTSENIKTISGAWTGKSDELLMTWDFSIDGGESDDTVRLCAISSRIVVIEATVFVATTCAGDGATVTIGIEGGQTDAFLHSSRGQVADLAAGYVVQEANSQGMLIDGSSATKYIAIDIADVDLTAGKIHLFMRYVKY